MEKNKTDQLCMYSRVAIWDKVDEGVAYSNKISKVLFTQIRSFIWVGMKRVNTYEDTLILQLYRSKKHED